METSEKTHIKSLVTTERLDKVNVDEVIHKINRFGWVLVRSTSETPDTLQYEHFTKKTGDSFQVHGNIARAMVSEDGLTQEVDAGTHPLPPHSEVTYMPFYPDTMWFFCVSPPSIGGQTIVADGVEIYKSLSPQAKIFFEKNRIQYQHVYSKEAWTRPLPVESTKEASDLIDAVLPLFAQRGNFQYRFDADDSMHTNYCTNAISQSRNGDKVFANSLEISYIPRVIELRGGCVSIEDGSDIPEQILKEIRSTVSSHEIEVRWEAGDILMIDNSRVMHGRREILSQEERKIYLRLGNRTA